MSTSAQADCPDLPIGETAQEWLLLVRGYAGDSGQEQTLLRDTDGFWGAAELFKQWRVPVPTKSKLWQGRRWHPLAAVRGLGVRFDACEQSLTLDFSQTRREAAVYSLRPAWLPSADARPGRPEGVSRPSLAPSPVAPGGFFNLDLQHSDVNDAVRTAGIFEAGLFNRYGRGGQTLVAREGGTVRLDSFWQIEDPERLSTLRLGDAISRTSAWGRSVRYAGLQWGTDFSLQPYRSLFPQPTLRGDAALPSTLDVFVDGSLRGRQEAQPGPFELSDIPSITGAGEATVVVRDALGRETRVTQPFYVSPTLLRSGLEDYSLETGWLRNNYSVTSNDYRDFFAATTLRRGFSDRFTGELRVEAGYEAVAAGVNALKQVGHWGLISSTLAFGGGPDASGWLAALGFERERSGAYSFALRSQWTESGFRQIGQPDDQLPSRRQDLARFSFQPHIGGSLSLLWTHDEARGRADIDVRSVAYGLRLGPSTQLDFSLADTCAPDCDPSALVNLTWTFGAQTSAFAQVDHTGEVTRSRAGAQGNPAGALGWSWRAMGEHSQLGDRADAGAALRNERGVWSADVAHQGDASYRLGAATGVAFLGGEAFWTRPVTGSFAVVDVDDLDGISIYADRRLVARTDEHGRALVPDLRAYEINTLSVEASDIPIEQQLDVLQQNVVPRSRSGVMATFPLDGEGRWLNLQRVDGRGFDATSVVRDAGTGEELPMSASGEILIHADRLPRVLRVEHPEGFCEAKIDLFPADHAKAVCVESSP